MNIDTFFKYFAHPRLYVMPSPLIECLGDEKNKCIRRPNHQETADVLVEFSTEIPGHTLSLFSSEFSFLHFGILYVLGKILKKIIEKQLIK